MLASTSAPRPRAVVTLAGGWTSWLHQQWHRVAAAWLALADRSDGGWVEMAGGQTERINTVLLDLDGTLYVGGPALTMRFHTNTDSVTPAALADRLGRLGAAATADELDAAFRPEGVDGHRDADRSPGDGHWPLSGARPAPTRSRQETTRWQGARARPRPACPTSPHRGEHDHRAGAAAQHVAGDPADPGHRSVLIGATPGRACYSTLWRCRRRPDALW
jgi:hypothetical protein